MGVSLGSRVAVSLGSAVPVGGGGVTLGGMVTSAWEDTGLGVESGVQATRKRPMMIGTSRGRIP